MILDFRDCKSPEDAERTAKRIIGANRRVLTGLAHYDRGERVPGCDCCYCTPSPDAIISAMEADR